MKSPLPSSSPDSVNIFIASAYVSAAATREIVSRSGERFSRTFMDDDAKMKSMSFFLRTFFIGCHRTGSPAVQARVHF